MTNTKIARSALLVGMAVLFAGQACAQLMFDGVQFELKASKQTGTGAAARITQSYEARGENQHQCSLYVYPRPQSSVSGILNVDKMVMRPPIVIAPLEIVRNPSQTSRDDAASIILVRHETDAAKYTVILHRATALNENLVREMQVECAVKYAGFFGKSVSEFERVKASWVQDVFALEPELVAPSPSAAMGQ